MDDMGSTHLPYSRRTPDHYTLLGVPKDAPAREIEQAYWREAIRSRELVPRLNEAYEILGDPKRRAEYDAERESVADQTPKQDAAKAPLRGDPELRNKLRWYLQ
jgi:curved DNA-binding protein CbpA